MILRGTPPPLSEILNKQTSHQSYTLKTTCICLYKNVLPSFKSRPVYMTLIYCSKQRALLLLTLFVFFHQKLKRKIENTYFNGKIFFSQDNNHLNWCKGRLVFLMFNCCPHCILKKTKPKRI